jgi:hypothetical protein
MKNVASVLHINRNYLRSIPFWMALHRNKFKLVQVHVPKSQPCSPVSGIPVNCISDDIGGMFASESVVHTIEKTMTWTGGQNASGTDGVLFLHDDGAWKHEGLDLKTEYRGFSQEHEPFKLFQKQHLAI